MGLQSRTKMRRKGELRMDKLQEVKEYFERLIEIYAEELTLKSNVKWLIEQAENAEKYEIALDEIYSVAKYFKLDLIPDEVRKIIKEVR